MSDISEVLKFRAWGARNPLGIIALFISLIYGMSAGLLGFSVDKLSPENQTRLVWFVVLFPCAVLLAFCWLVARHHRKLYGPSDFRSDEGFLHAGEQAPSVALGERLVAEVAAGEAAEVDAALTAQSETGSTGPLSNESAAGTVHSATPKQIHSAATVFLLEGLVFQELQGEFNGSVRKEVSILTPQQGKITVDGIIETHDRLIVVEIKTLRGDFSRRIREARTTAKRYIEAFRSDSAAKWQILFAFVLDRRRHAPGVILQSIEEFRKSLNGEVIVRTYDTDELLQKYGFPVGQSEGE